MNDALHIAYLCDHPAEAPRLARWHYRQWRDLLPDWSEAAALAELQTHTRRTHLPTTLLAFAAGELCGSVSLLVSDHALLPQYTPWLASLYVDAPWRGRGIGLALVQALVAEARALGIARLYLYTEDARRWYERQGWVWLDSAVLDGHPVDILGIAP